MNGGGMLTLRRDLGLQWQPMRPHVLVVACSDGRLQVATDAFLSSALGVLHYDRLYVPGGAGGLATGGGELLRAREIRRECRFLVEAHQVEQLVLLFHGPATGGPDESVCADYRRKHLRASAAEIRARQEADAVDIIQRREEFAGEARVSIYRFEVAASRELSVAALHEDEGRPSPL